MHAFTLEVPDPQQEHRVLSPLDRLHMTAQELQTAINAALGIQPDFPWLGYLAIIVVSFAGGFLGAYVKKKGEHLATREEFNTLLEQTRKTTQDTEKIKIELASHNWLNQQQWQLREKHYAALLEGLFKLKITLEERAGYFREPGSEHRVEHTRTEHFRMQDHLGAEAFEKIQRLTGPAAVVISNRAVAALERLGNEHQQIRERSASLAEYLNAFLATVTAVYACVLEEARAELLGRAQQVWEE